MTHTNFFNHPNRDNPDVTITYQAQVGVISSIGGVSSPDSSGSRSNAYSPGDANLDADTGVGIPSGPSHNHLGTIVKRGPMQQAYKMTDLAPEERTAIERLLGRSLENDEAVEVITHKVDDLWREQETVRRRQAAARIRELAKGKSLGGATVRELIDEGRRF